MKMIDQGKTPEQARPVQEIVQYLASLTIKETIYDTQQRNTMPTDRDMATEVERQDSDDSAV